MDLKHRVIVISGGTKGVGRAAAEECARRGATVVVGGRDEMAGENTVKLINTYKQAGLFVRTELARTGDCKKLFDKTMETFGKVDGYLNYAGVTPVSPLESCCEATYNAVMDINLRAAFFCCQNAVHCMRLNKGRGGSIILVGSAHAWSGEKDRAAYAISKGALLTLNEHIARNYAAEKIRCNYLTLGWTPTEGEVALRHAQGIGERELRKNAAQVIPMGRMLEPGDYVATVALLFSDHSSMMTGANLRITGGQYI